MKDVLLRIARACGASGHASVAACPKARMSAHAHKVFVTALAVLLLCSSFVPSRAYADVAWMETGSNMAGLVYDYDYTEQGRRSALAEFVGYNWDTMSNTVKLKVLQDSTVAFCLDPTNRRCINVAYEWWGDVPVFSQAIEMVFTIFGRQRVWQCSMTSDEYFAVQDAFKNAVYPNSGGGSGGGSGTSLPEGYEDLPTSGSRSGDVFTLASEDSGVSSVVVDLSSVTNDLSSDHIYVGTTKSGNYIRYTFAVVPDDGLLFLCATGRPIPMYVYNPTDTTKTYIIYSSNTQKSQTDGVYKYSSLGTIDTRTIQANTLTLLPYSYRNCSVYYYGGNAVTLPPYQPEPDPPAQQPTLNAPTAPTLPTTNAPTTPDSTPNSYTTIINNNYTQPTYNQQPTGTSQDYTPWLDEIIVLLRSINDYIYLGFDDLSTWFSVVDSDMRTGFDNVLARLSSLKTGVHSDLVWLSNNLEDWISDAALYLATYLHDCELYLGEIVGEYTGQISSVVTWLRRIYSRLGGNGASKPSVTTDEPGFFDWLIDLFTRFLDDLLSNLPEWLQRLIGGFQDLSEHFPFSIPWDIAAMLQLLYHEPVTPVFDLPMPTITINGASSVSVHIDLSSWNGVAAIVREMVFIIFAVSLALNTKKLLSNLDM